MVLKYLSRVLQYPKWPRRLVIVRHGHSEQNATTDLLNDDLEAALQWMRTIRDADITLTSLGKFQAEETGKYLAQTQPFDICFSSPYRRTVETAEGILAQFSYVPPHYSEGAKYSNKEKRLHYPAEATQMFDNKSPQLYVDDRLREKEFGVLHARTKEEIREKYPDEYEARKREGKYWYRLLGGENYPDVGQRVHSFSDKLVRDWGGKDVLVVTHQVPYKLFRQQFEHLREQEVLALEDAPNCGMQEYQLDRSFHTPEGFLRLVEWNKVAYDAEKEEQSGILSPHSATFLDKFMKVR
jgi:broad specificity phosphatase PhoE